MKIKIIWIGKTNESYLEQGIALYLKRLKHYCKVEISEIKDIKKFSSEDDLKEKEAEEIQKKITNEDYVILLDEKGKNYSSVEWSNTIEKYQTQGRKSIVFVIGGAFGFDQSLYKKAQGKLSLSRMTFSHQMIRLFFVEQLYRGFTIIKNEKYHNE